MPPAKPDALEEAVTAPEHPLLAQIHAKLLRLPASSQQKWRGSILRYITNHPQYFGDHLPSLASEEDYDSITPRDKLVLLHALAEAVLSEHPPDATVEQLRPFPVGYDALKNQYWYFGDAQRVYREPGEAVREKEEREARAEEQQRKAAEKEERRREREEKRVQNDKKKVERRKRDAHKWAPRVAVGRSTRASRRLQEKADMTRDADGQHSADDGDHQMEDVEPPRRGEGMLEDENEKPDAVINDCLLREIGITSDDDDEEDEKPPAKQVKAPPEEEQHAPRRSGRRRKPTQPPASPPAKRPRRRDRSREAPAPDPPPPPPPKRKEFADPTLRACTEWETLTTNASELRAFIERFGAPDKLAPVERSLLKRLDEVLPEMDEAEARTKREEGRKAKTEFLMLNQKRSTRVQAIRSRREEEARLEAEREEMQREEAVRLAAHQRAVLDSMAFLVRDQSRDIRGARREFGMYQEIDRDEGAVQKQDKEKAHRAVAAAPVRRSARAHRAKRQFAEGGEQKTSADTTIQTPETTAGATPENTAETAVGSVDEAGAADDLETKTSSKVEGDASERETVLNEEGRGTSEDLVISGGVIPERSKAQNGDVTMQLESADGKSEPPHPDEQGKDKDLEERGTMIDSAEGTVKSSPEAEPRAERKPIRLRFSSAPGEESVVPSFTWSTNDEDKLPMRVLDKFFFASHSSFADAQLEECEDPESKIVCLGLLIPPTTSEPYAERVELSRISEWMFEYGSSPKIWIRTPYAWYELREAAVEYRNTFTTARRKFEICARVAIMGDTMRGPQLNYSSILDYLSYPYSEMLAYKEEDVLTEKRYIVSQMELLNKRSLLQSGFMRELQKRIRAEDKKAAIARAKAETREATMVMKQDEELAGVKEEDVVLVQPLAELKNETAVNDSSQANDVKRDSEGVKASGENEEKKAKEKTKRSSKKRSGRTVPRVVSAIVNGLLRSATKSYKAPRKRKSKPTENGASPTSKSATAEEMPAARGGSPEGGMGSAQGWAVSTVAPVQNGGGAVAGVRNAGEGEVKDEVAVKPFARRAARKEGAGIAPRLVGHGMSPFVGSPRPGLVGKTARYGYANGIRRDDSEKE